MTLNKIVFNLFFCSILISCNENSIYKENHDFKDALWTIKDQQVFEFEIKDSVSFYSLNLLFRNNMDYPYYNLFINESLQDKNGVMDKGMQEINFFDPVTGKPLGSGLGDIFDHQLAIQKYKKFKFPRNGKYKFIISHNMRPDPLIGVMSVGLSVEKLK